jgi:hypothetical protein
MSDPHPIMAMLLEQSTFLGGSESIEHEIMPLDEQLNFGPGDVAILAGSNVPLERDFAIVRGLDPQQHAETFPDWEERMLGTGPGWNSHVLCEHFSQTDPNTSLGWFSRLKLMPITKYRYKECRQWLNHGFPKHLPKWVEETYQKYTDMLAERAPAFVPQSVACPECGEREVQLRVTRRISWVAKVGRVMVEGREKYVPVQEPDEDDKHVARLYCTVCRTSADLSDEEWQLPDITN